MSKSKQAELIPGENAKAIVVRRASRGGDRYYWPTRLYISCSFRQTGKAIPSPRPESQIACSTAALSSTAAPVAAARGWRHSCSRPPMQSTTGCSVGRTQWG